MRLKFLLFLTCTLLITVAHGQRKIKYKDLYPLLKSQQYEVADSLLRAYLKQEPEEANPRLQMALMLDRRSRDLDILNEVEALKVATDSAEHYYRQAIVMIDDRELRKNDEYYTEYNRRDMRTGKYDIKLSDVHFDIEKAIEELRLRYQNVVALNTLYKELNEHYAKTQAAYATLAQAFATPERMYLLADAATLQQLATLQGTWEATLQKHKQYQKKLSEIPYTEYTSTLERQPLTDFPNDGKAGTDFTQATAVVWDYAAWVKATQEVITEDIPELRQALVDYDAKFSLLYGDAQNGRDIRPQLKRNEDLLAQLQQYEEHSLPEALFDYKLQEMRYYLAEQKLADPKDFDTVAVLPFVTTHDSVHEVLKAAEEAYATLTQKDIEEAYRAYAPLFDKRYNGIASFKGYLKNRQEFLNEEREQLDGYREGWKKREAEGLWAPDTVLHLVTNDTVFEQDSVTAGTYVLTLKNNEAEDGKWVGGMYYQPDSALNGFTGYIGPERYAYWKLQMPLDSFPTVDSLLDLAVELVLKDDDMHYVVFHNRDSVASVFPTQVAFIDSGKVQWSHYVPLRRALDEVRYRTFEQDVKLYLMGANGEPEETAYVVLNLDGTLKEDTTAPAPAEGEESEEPTPGTAGG